MVKYTKIPTNITAYDLQENIELAVLDVRNHIKENGCISWDEYKQVARWYRVGEKTLQEATAPLSEYCTECWFMVNEENYDKNSYKCKPCKEKHDKFMKGFVMQKYYEEAQKIPQKELIHAIKHASNYEADLYVDGKLIYSPLGLDREDNMELLAKYGVTRGENGLKYIDDSKNVRKLYLEYWFYTYEGKKKLSCTIRDYLVSEEDIAFDTEEEIKDYIVNTLCAKQERDGAEVSWYLKHMYTVYWEKEKGWLTDKQYYIVGVDSDDHEFSPPHPLCVYADNKEDAFEKYIAARKRQKMFHDEIENLKVFGTSKYFISGDLQEYVTAS